MIALLLSNLNFGLFYAFHWKSIVPFIKYVTIVKTNVFLDFGYVLLEYFLEGQGFFMNIFVLGFLYFSKSFAKSSFVYHTY